MSYNDYHNSLSVQHVQDMEYTKQDSNGGRLVEPATEINTLIQGKRVSWDEYFEAIARIVSSRSTCPRKQVGAVIVVDKRILATGYNGSRKGEAHCSDVGCDVVSDHCIRTIHAEENAVIQFTELFGWDYWDADVHIYCTLEPCGTCMRLIHQHFESPFIHWQESTEDYNRGKLQG